MQDITFVCCVESGFLESQTLIMIESLRRWGGKYKDLPILAITPRAGPPLSKSFKEKLSHFNVTHLSFDAKNIYSWKAFLNKHYSLAKAEEVCDTEFICWLDSDLLFLKEPDGLFLRENEDFIACPVDTAGASTGPSDPMEPYWRKVCSIFDLHVESLPWVEACLERTGMRFYFNSGIFMYRRSTAMSARHLENTLKFFDMKVSSKITGSFFTQHILGLTVFEMGLNWTTLHHTHNYGAGAKILNQWVDPDNPVKPEDETFKNCKVLHYHNSMWNPHYPLLVEVLGRHHPSMAAWLRSKSALRNEAPIFWRLWAKILKYVRATEEASYLRQCRVI